MSRMRVLVVEAEMADGGWRGFIQEALSAFGVGGLALPVELAPALPAAPAITDALPPDLGFTLRAGAAPRSAKPRKSPAKKATAGGGQRAAAPAPPVAEDGSTRALILAALGKRPMTSGEVMKDTGLPNSKVYSMLNILRNEGLVKSVKDESSMYPKQLLVK